MRRTSTPRQSTSSLPPTMTRDAIPRERGLPAGSGAGPRGNPGEGGEEAGGPAEGAGGGAGGGQGWRGELGGGRPDAVPGLVADRCLRGRSHRDPGGLLLLP